MQLKMYTVRDSKVEAYLTPFFQRSHGEAERSFQKLATDKNTTVGANPSDFDLYFLGTYDDQTGKTEVMDTPQHVIKATALTQ